KDPTQPVNPTHVDTSAWRSPAVGALMEIGELALPALVKVIEKHKTSPLETQNALEVLIYISRYKRTEYVDKLKQAAAEAHSPEAGQRLLRAAEILKESKR